MYFKQLFLLIAFIFTSASVFSEEQQNFVKEFNNAYPKEIKKTGITKTIDMTANLSEFHLLGDDQLKTKTWSYNKKTPAPEIRLKLGDTLKINFTNKLPQETTIHFHGIRVPNAMDGVPGVTQAPIKSGEKFVYEFTPKDAGTYWYHPHVRSAEQMERGLYGVIVVEDSFTKQYSQDMVWVIDDWRLQREDLQIYPHFVTPMDLMHDGRWGNVVTVNNTTKEELIVKPGERIRLRLVNTSNARIYKLDLAGLDAKVVAFDGLAVKKVFDAQDVVLSSGNRVDLDIKISPLIQNKSFQILDTFTRNPIKLAKITVKGEPVKTPDFAYPVNKKIPDWKEAINHPIDKEYRLSARRKQLTPTKMGGIEWTINDKAYPDYDPFKLKFNKFNKLRFVNESSRLHPMHLHGQFFKVIARNGKAANENYFRDTVLVRPKETLDIATIPLDKGDWLNHCHILEHAESGMMTRMTVD